MISDWSAGRGDAEFFRRKYRLTTSDYRKSVSINPGKTKWSAPSQGDNMKTPDHYDLPIQPVDFILANRLGFCEGNVVKYISRWQSKSGRADLLKAKHYIDILITQLDKDSLDSYNNKGQSQ